MQRTAWHDVHSEAVCRLQQELASQQTTIRGMLDEKAALLEQLSQRTQALDAAAANCTRLSEEAKERERLQQLYTQIQEELNQHLMHRSAQESVLHETMRQLAVAKQLLVDLNDGVERQKLGAADAEVRRLHQLLAERGTEARATNRAMAVPACYSCICFCHLAMACFPQGFCAIPASSHPAYCGTISSDARTGSVCRWTSCSSG